ncbi:gdsl esterase/lipase [Quercus suber]|uniref:Gdsl esterase/lipase n=1 Tax=Quercus suber TaxID=58331 RepID=A0AAW0KQS0_QUESU
MCNWIGCPPISIIPITMISLSFVLSTLSKNCKHTKVGNFANEGYGSQPNSNLKIYIFSFYCAEKLKSALFIVGGIGENDYNIALQHKTVEEARYLVPQVVKAIKDAVTRVIGYGAVRVVVPGHFPIGCSPIYLTKFHSKNSAHYDELHCLKGLNNLSISQ